MGNEKTRTSTIATTTRTDVTEGGQVFVSADKGRATRVTNVGSGPALSIDSIFATFDIARGFRSETIEIPYDARRAERRRANLNANQGIRNHVDTTSGE